MRIDYSWNLDNTVASRTETKYDSMGPTEVAVVTFTHDNRARLIAETRVVDQTTTVYNLAYTYDQLGNRLTRHDAVAGMLTAYTYDVQFNYENFPDPDHKTKNNRLLWYTESFGDEQSGWTLARTVKYLYYNTGHVANITIKDEYLGTGETPAAYDYYYDLALHYATNGHLWRVIWDQWKVDPESGNFTDYSMTAAREFYYDSGRARYMTRDVDPNSNYAPATPWYWTDYQGDQPYADFTHSGGQNETPAEATRFLPGYGVHAQQTLDNETNPTRYLHGDLVRSTMLITNESGTAASTVAYTAFGEPITPGGVGVPPANFDTRYQYAGGWGYESDFLTLTGATTSLPPITLLHVGERWYQPSIGRFIQRDPLGITAGVNVYLYCDANPCATTDPAGLFNWGRAIITGVAAGITGAILGGPLMGLICGVAGFSFGGQDLDDGDAAYSGFDFGLTVCAAIPFDPNQAALIDLAKAAKRTGVSEKEAQILIDWAKLYKVRHWGPEEHPTRPFSGRHIRIGPVNHIPIY